MIDIPGFVSRHGNTILSLHVRLLTKFLAPKTVFKVFTTSASVLLSSSASVFSHRSCTCNVCVVQVLMPQTFLFSAKVVPSSFSVTSLTNACINVSWSFNYSGEEEDMKQQLLVRSSRKMEEPKVRHLIFMKSPLILTPPLGCYVTLQLSLL